MSQFPKTPGDDLDGFLDPIDSEEKYTPLDPRINQPINKNLSAEVVEDLEYSFLQSNVSDVSKREGKKEADYLSSKYRTEKYKTITNEDLEFNKYLRGIYGSAENYLEMNNFILENKVYDPETDYQAEVEIITEDTFYKSYFISQQETILELLDGVCTVEYFKVDGSIDRLVCSLSKDEIPESQIQTRLNAFAGLRGDRVLVWNLIKRDWASFYMSNLKRFIRDDTSGIQ
jgi:hypothetical protein